MSDHVWVQEHVAAYLAGGLDAREAERLEAHARECTACAAVLAEARKLDSGLSALFASAHPDAGLEDRAIARLREAPSPRRKLPTFGRGGKWALAVAAMLLLGVVGWATDRFTSNGGLRKPGAPRGGVRDLRVMKVGGLDDGLSNEDPGLDSKIEAALPEIDRLDKYTGDVAETKNKIGQPDSPNTDTTALAPPGIGPTDFTGKLFEPTSLKPSTSPPPGGSLGPPPGPTPQQPPLPSIPAPVPVTPPVFDPTKSRPELPEPLKPGDPKAEPPNKADPPKVDPKNPDPNPNPEPVRRIIIRSGDIEFEIESFDAATATITKLVLGIKGAFIGTVNSDKLPNGKVKGTITVRCPPEQLDGLVLDLRKELGKDGELKGIKLSSQDVTKMYTDLESRVKAARTMETRLIQIIKEGKGEIEQLLKAEKELGVWRTKIEEFEGEIRYYSNLAAFSTLNIVLTEKEIRAAAAITERERVQAGVEVEDVDKAYQAILAAVVEAKGRITKSELKQLSVGQFNATFNFEVAAESAGPIRDRLRMLGRVARLEIDRSVQTEGGTLPSDAKTKRGDTAFYVQLYNLANIAPRETATLQIAVADVPTTYQTLRDAVAKTTGRVRVAELDVKDKQNITAQLEFEVRRTEEGAVRAAVEAGGDIIARQVTRAPESDSVTDTKVLYKVTLLSANRLKAKETATLQVAAMDVPVAYQSLRDAVSKANGRVLVAQLNEQDRQSITARFDFEIRRADEVAIRATLDALGDVLSRHVARAETDGTTDAKVLYTVALLPANRLKPRETTTTAVEVSDVDGAATLFAAQVAEVKGRQVDAKFDRDASGRATAKLVFEVPLAAAPGLLERLKSSGKVRQAQSVRDLQATEGKFATARLHVTLTNVEAIVPDDSGLWPEVRRGLAGSTSFLLKSLSWVVFGLIVVLPWAVLGFGGYRVVRRFVRPSAPPAAPVAPAEPLPPPPAAPTLG